MRERPDYYPVAWVRTEFKGHKEVKGIKEAWVGFCGKTKHIFTVATDDLHPLIVNDLIVHDDDCEEGKRCCYFKCPLNRTSPQAFLKDAGFAKRSGGKPTHPSLGEMVWPDSLGELHSGVYMTQAGKPVFKIW
jgi:hypothetical protein